ncbi:HpaA family protein [Helicobacter ailurogastricus]|uniref:HpaA family protein n=1 Tax=Helicobacter ailurogastricus TaxID=1578720 RepID=UPI0022C87F5D|nr:HpaA family protein [Helicobacter ailurogastricus]GLH58643.1 Neuraminyllactose-binding hemagglutinin [Helicobacter ailurogastricus]GLH60172.1 Neuraminyllactose-binding hemagglutinin [Helicobacter ailurogastricus]
MRKCAKGVLLALTGISLVLSGCVAGVSTKSKPKGSDLLDFNRPIDIKQEASNNHTIAILTPHIQADENVQPYIDQFQSALARQAQEIFEKEGYHIIRLADAQNLTPAQKNEIYTILKIKGWVGVLEDANINTANPQDTDMDTTVDQSAGAVIFKFFEPKTGRTTHIIAINIGAEHALTYARSPQEIRVDGFAGANSISRGASSSARANPPSRAELEKIHDNAIRGILNKVYGFVIKKMVSWVTNTDLKQYRRAIDQIRK